MQKNAVVIGAGFGGISSAAYLARAGYKVTVLEKNSWVGGRAQVFERDGFRFDMGPSWYLLSEEFDKWFGDFGKDRSHYYQVKDLPTQYKVFFSQVDQYCIPNNIESVQSIFESIETGAGMQLKKYLRVSQYFYNTALSQFVYKNFDSVLSMISPKILKAAFSMKAYRSYRKHIRKYFQHPYLLALLEYPTVFLGSSAESLPAVYTLMNWVDFGQGAQYPDGGYSGVAQAMRSVAESMGAVFMLNQEVTELIIDGASITGVKTKQGVVPADVIVANADYHYVDQILTPKPLRYTNEKQWNKKKLSPTTLNFYIALKKTIPEFEAHTFFFDSDWQKNFDDVYIQKRYNKKPLFYIHVPSRVDANVAPSGCETLFILIPVAAGTDDTEEIRKHYFDHVLDRIEFMLGYSIREYIVFFKSYGQTNYMSDYNAYKGNAFGLGQTLFQTAAWRPPNKNPHLKNLYYAGQYTLPGTGVSMAMISGKVVSERIIRDTRHMNE